MPWPHKAMNQIIDGTARPQGSPAFLLFLPEKALRSFSVPRIPDWPTSEGEAVK